MNDPHMQFGIEQAKKAKEQREKGKKAKPAEETVSSSNESTTESEKRNLEETEVSTTIKDSEEDKFSIFQAYNSLLKTHPFIVNTVQSAGTSSCISSDHSINFVNILRSPSSIRGNYFTSRISRRPEGALCIVQLGRLVGGESYGDDYVSSHHSDSLMVLRCPGTSEIKRCSRCCGGPISLLSVIHSRHYFIPIVLVQ